MPRPSHTELVVHFEQAEFVRRLAQEMPQFFVGQRVLEVGSLDIRGSIREFFVNCEYVGVDVGAGKGVDLIAEGQLLDFPSGHFDVAISCEAMEHNPFWVETFANMLRMTRPGGLVVMTCATTGREEHGTSRTTPEHAPLSVTQTWDYYKNLTAKDFRQRFALDRWFVDYEFFENWNSHDLYFVGIRTLYSGSGTAPHPLDAARSTVRSLCEPRAGLWKVAAERLIVIVLGKRRFGDLKRAWWRIKGSTSRTKD